MSSEDGETKFNNPFSNADAPPVAAPPSPTGRRRRSSLVEFFSARPTVSGLATGGSISSQQQQQPAMAAALSQQAQEAGRNRRLSITALGLSGSSPTSASPFGSLSRAKTSSVADQIPRQSIDEERDENAIDDSDYGSAPTSPPPTSNGFGNGNGNGESSSINTPGRRMSFGARIYGQTRSVNSDPTSPPPVSPGSPKSSSPPSSRKDAGFSWSENFRSRAQRASISAASGSSPFTAFGGGGGSFGGGGGGGGHMRSTSQGMNSGPAQAPAPVAPKPAQKAPDHFQERILKGDFYMD